MFRVATTLGTSEEIRKVLCLIKEIQEKRKDVSKNQGSFNFCIVFSRTTTFSTLNHTPSEVRQSPNFTVVFYAVTIKCTYVFCEAKTLNGQ